MTKRFMVLVGFICLLGCGKEKPELVARIGLFFRIVEPDLDSAIISLRYSERSQYQNPQGRKKFFDRYLREQVLFRAAKKTKYHKKTSVRIALEQEQKRWAAALFETRVMHENHGFLGTKLKRYYRKNIKLFRKIDPKTAPQEKKAVEYIPFLQAKQAIVDSLILAQSDLRKLYDENRSEYKTRASAKIAHVFSADRQKIDACMNALNKGIVFEEAVEKFSDDTATVSNKGVLGTHWQNSSLPHEFGVIPELDRLLFGHDSTPGTQTRGFTKVIQGPRGYHIFNILEVTPEVLKSFDEIQPELRELALQTWKQNVTPRTLSSLKNKYKLRLVDTVQVPQEASILSYYKKFHAEAFAQNPIPNDSLRSQISAILADTLMEQFEPGFVFARATRRFRITKASLDSLLEQVPPHHRTRYRTRKGRDYLVDYLVRSELFYREAKQGGFLRQPDIREEMKGRVEKWLATRFEREFLDQDLGFSEKELQRFYRCNRARLFRDTASEQGYKPFERVRVRIAEKMLDDSMQVEHYFLLHAEEFARADTIPPLTAVYSQVHATFLAHQKRLRKAKTYRLLCNLLGVRIVKKEYAVELPEKEKDLFQSAQEILTEGGDAKRAQAMLVKLRDEYPNTEHGDDICFMLGQLHNANGEHPKAIWEFRKLLRLYPQSRHNYKAQFMIGYVYSESLQDLDKARVAYEKVISNYADCELVDDAQFMIKYLGKDLSEIEFLKQDPADTVGGDSVSAGEPAS